MCFEIGILLSSKAEQVAQIFLKKCHVKHLLTFGDILPSKSVTNCYLNELRNENKKNHKKAKKQE